MSKTGKSKTGSQGKGKLYGAQGGKGPDSHMFPQQSAGPATPGISGTQKGRTAPSGGKWGKGGGKGYVGNQSPGRQAIAGKVALPGGK